MIKGKETLKEIPRIQRYITRPSPEDVLIYENKKERDKAIFEAHRAVNRIEGK